MKDQFEEENLGTYYITNPGAHSILEIFKLESKYSKTIIGAVLPLPKLSIEEVFETLEDSLDINGEGYLENNVYDPAEDVFADLEKIDIMHKWAFGIK